MRFYVKTTEHVINSPSFYFCQSEGVIRKTVQSVELNPARMGEIYREPL